MNQHYRHYYHASTALTITSLIIPARALGLAIHFLARRFGKVLQQTSLAMMLDIDLSEVTAAELPRNLAFGIDIEPVFIGALAALQ